MTAVPPPRPGPTTPGVTTNPPAWPRIEGVHEHVTRQVDAGHLAIEPFPHLVVEDALPSPWFLAVAERAAAVTSYESMGQNAEGPLAQYTDRSTVLLTAVPRWPLNDEGRRWTDVTRLFRDVVGPALEGRLQRWLPPLPELDNRVCETRLNLDDAGSRLGPHPDAAHKTYTAVLYLSSPAPECVGTALYQRSADADAEPLARGEVAFRPNRLLAFARSEDSLHGMDHVTEAMSPRYTLLHTVWAR